METARTPAAAPVAVLLLARRPARIRAGARGHAADALAFKDVVRRLTRDHSRASAGERRRRGARPPRRHRVLHPRLIVPHDVGVVHPRERVDLAQDLLDVLAASDAHHFDGVLHLVQLVPHVPHAPKPALAELADHLEVSKEAARRRAAAARVANRVQRRESIAERHRRARGIDALVVVAKDVVQVFVAGGVARLAAAAAAARGRAAAEELRDRVANGGDGALQVA